MSTLTSRELRNISEALATASAYGLQAEVIYSALLYMKRFPKSTPLDAITHGMLEWIK